MWSDQYYYLSLRPDNISSEHVKTAQIRNFLLTLPQFEQKSQFEFRNSNEFEFTTINILKIEDFDSWNSSQVDAEFSNFISIVTSKSPKIEFESIKNVIVPIAKFLNWKLIDEHTDDGQENFVVWQPKK